MAAKRPYLDDLQTARLWAKIKALVSPLSTRLTTLEGQVQTNTTDLPLQPGHPCPHAGAEI